MNLSFKMQVTGDKKRGVQGLEKKVTKSCITNLPPGQVGVLKEITEFHRGNMQKNES